MNGRFHPLQVPTAMIITKSNTILTGRTRININTASNSKLDQLYGIGPAKAEAIIDARPYNSVDELTRAHGIGDVTLSRIEDYITAEGSSSHQTDDSSSSAKININTASRSKLKSLDGIGEVLS